MGLHVPQLGLVGLCCRWVERVDEGVVPTGPQQGEECAGGVGEVTAPGSLELGTMCRKGALVSRVTSQGSRGVCLLSEKQELSLGGCIWRVSSV